MLRIDIGLSREALKARLFDVIEANGMTDGVHIRLMVTRGVKRSPYQDPRLTVGAATIVIIPEWKRPQAGDVRPRRDALHRPYPPHRAGRAGPEAQLAFQAQLHPRLHPGDGGRRGRGADARRPRLRRHLQFHAFLHRAQGRGVDLGRRLLPRRHHARRGAARRRGARAFRRSRRIFRCSTSMAPTRPSPPARSPGSFRSRRSTAGRSASSVGAADDRSGPMTRRLRAAVKALEAEEAAGEAADERRPARAHRDVVRSAQHLDRDDARVRRAGGLRGHRRAVLRRLSRRHRPRPSDARRGDRLAADRLARRSPRRSSVRLRTASRSGTRST